MSLLDNVKSALEVPSRSDATSAVHEAVANAVKQLDPSIGVRTTDYFTHSFVPDLIVSWEGVEGREQRPVHLRFNLNEEAFAQDLAFLADESPLFWGLIDTAPLTQAAWSNSADGALNGTLVTQTVAADRLYEGVERDHRTQKATSEIVRDGRGKLDNERADSVVDAYAQVLSAIERLPDDPQAAAGTVTDALTLLEPFFSLRGRYAVERTLQSFWIRHGGDPFDFPAHVPWDPQALDEATLGDVLNSLLDSERDVTTESWVRNAGFLGIDELGRVLGGPRRGGALNKLAAALISGLTAQWAWAERMPAPPLEETYEWLVDNKTLGVEVGDIQVFFADDGRRFKEKEGDQPLPRLSDAGTILSETGVLGVGLRKPQEGIRYEVRGSQAQPVFDRITSLLSEEGSGGFEVEALTVAVPGTDRTAEIDFDRQIIDLDKAPTPLTKLARMAMRFFSRAGYEPERLEGFLKTGEIGLVQGGTFRLRVPPGETGEPGAESELPETEADQPEAPRKMGQPPDARRAPETPEIDRGESSSAGERHAPQLEPGDATDEEEG
jgi:hypothetical protein